MTDTGSPFDRPGAEDLVTAVRDELAELVDRLSGRDRWLVRIATNALSIAGRELEFGPAMTIAHRDRLAEFGMADDVEMVDAIRSGAFDDQLAEVGTALWATTLDKLRVANPNYIDESGG